MLQLHDEKIPLREADGVVYVGDTRVTMDCVVEMFDHGASPEEIAEEYDALALADVYAVITYYLRNKKAVSALLSHGAAESEESVEARKSTDAAFPSHLRQKLLRARSDKGGPGGGG